MAAHKQEKIGLWTAVAVGMKSMVGAGIFATTSLLGSKIGPAGILTYLCAFVAIWFIAQSFARVAYLYPQEGSFYNYARQTGGHMLGLLSAGAYLVGLLIAMGLLSKIAAIYASAWFPAISVTTLNISIIAFLLALNIFGVKLSSLGIYILLCLAVYSLAITTALCLSNFDVNNLTPFMPYGPGSIISGIKVAMFGLFGFESIASLFSIVQNPEQNVPKALRLTILFVGIIYLVFISSILVGIPQDVFALNPDSTIPDMLTQVFPAYPWLIASVGVAIFFAILGTVHAMIWSSSQLMLSYFKVLRCPWLQKQIERNVITSKTCVLICGAVILFSCLLITNMAMFFSMTNVFILFAFISSISALLYLPKEWKSGQNYITVLGLLAACIIFVEAAKTLLKNIISLLN